eukprot:gnl/Hemi2/25503_TR8575_c0_g1_i1.p1 gnl/Hemi2/25503_TR8575_c0_g1~~gnl/Hemi2/25503_TR8575_c0_g1_i1.p1  ORF type:complete len:153 (-),score=30.28 gnl/Hemi2/25503_TR8575_c0_g1_i1:311-769(-)
MGRNSPLTDEQILAEKVHNLYTEVSRKLSLQNPNYIYSFADFVEQLDDTDKFAKHLFELLIKETYTRHHGGPPPAPSPGPMLGAPASANHATIHFIPSALISSSAALQAVFNLALSGAPQGQPQPSTLAPLAPLAPFGQPFPQQQQDGSGIE